MATQNSSPEFHTWSAEPHTLKVLYTKAVMDQMSEAAWEGLQKVPRRGLEVGGVLYGARSGNEIRVTEWRPIDCEHANGPGFELSDRDRAALAAKLEQSTSEPELSGLEPVGWFHSHTRDGVFLSAKDVDIYQRFFPAPWQIALVLKPHSQQPTRAGFFFREDDGSLHSTASYCEFRLTRRSRRLPVGFDPADPGLRTPVGGRSLDTSAPTPLVGVPRPPGPVRRPVPAEPPVMVEPPERKPPTRRGLFVLTALLFVVPVLVVLGLPLLDEPLSASVTLQVRDEDGQLVLEWDRGAEATLAADRGILHILDGTNEYQLDLSQRELRTGHLTYARETGDVEIRLELIQSEGEAVREIARFLGEPPAVAPGHTGPDNLAQRLELEAEADRLRRRLEEEAARNKELRDRVRILSEQLMETLPGAPQPQP